MYGGSITENTGDYPGVCLAYSNNRPRTFTMYGGEITNNKIQAPLAVIKAVVCMLQLVILSL